MNFIKTNKNIGEVINWKSNGCAYRKNDKDKDGKYKIFTIKNISSSNKYSLTDLQNNNLMQIGDIITGLSGTIGTSKIILEKNWVSNQRTLAMRSKTSLDVFFSILKGKKILDTISTGAAQKNIKAINVLCLPFYKSNSKSFSHLFIKASILRNNLMKVLKQMLKLLIK